jgi:sugar lactone lactonase YvrE
MIDHRLPSLASTLSSLALVAMLSACGSGSAENTGMEEAPAADAAMSVPDDVAPDLASLPGPYDVTRNWGEDPGHTWGRVSGVGLDPDGVHIWVAERCGGDVCIGTDFDPVLQYEPNGTLVRSFGAGLIMRPHGLHGDADGNIWVTDERGPRPEELEEHPDWSGTGQQVVKFSPDGDVLMVLGTPGEEGDPADGKPTQPNDVVTAPNGDIYVSEGHSPNGPVARVSRFAADGTFIESFGELGEGPGQFRVPHALAIDAQNRLYVGDRSNNRVEVFDLDGNYLDQFHHFGRPSDVFVSTDERLFTVDYDSGGDSNPDYRRGVYVGDALTGQLTAFVPGHEVEGQPLGAAGEGIVEASDGALYVGEVSLQGMTKYEPK